MRKPDWEGIVMFLLLPQTWFWAFIIYIVLRAIVRGPCCECP